MNLNINVDLQDIFDSTNEQAYQEGAENSQGGECYSLNAHVMQEVINGILGKVSKECLQAVMKKANDQIDKALSSAIEKSIESIEQRSVDYANDWLENKHVKITDSWGSVKFDGKIEGLVQQKFEDALKIKVDERGRIGGDSYGNKSTLLDYTVGNQVKKLVGERIPDFTKKIDLAVKSAVEEEMQKSLSKKIKTIIDKAG